MELNGMPVSGPPKMMAAVAALKVGGVARMTIVRGEQTLRIEVTVVERPLLPWDVAPGKAAAPADGRPFSRPVRRGF